MNNLTFTKLVFKKKKVKKVGTLKPQEVPLKNFKYKVSSSVQLGKFYETGISLLGSPLITIYPNV